LKSSPVAVPASFVGFHLTKYPDNPSGPPLPTPNFTYGTYRTHDNGLTWRLANPASGTYNWDMHDHVLGYHASLGHRVIYTIFGTPRWAARPIWQSTLGPYTNLGECSPPNNNSDLVAFIQALLARYPNQIHALELWNEPNFRQDGTGFYWGSAADLVTSSALVTSAAKALVPSIEILSPGFDSMTWCQQWLAAQGSSGAHGYEVIDSLALHPYYGTPYIGGDYSIITDRVRPSFAAAALALAAAGASTAMPIHFTEFGFSASNDAALSAFLNLPTAERFAAIARRYAVAAALGARSFCAYSYSSKFSGDFIGDSEGVIAGLQDVQDKVAGKTIDSSYINQAGRLRLAMSDGSQIVF